MAVSRFVSTASRVVSAVAAELLVPGAEKILFSFSSCLNYRRDSRKLSCDVGV